MAIVQQTSGNIAQCSLADETLFRAYCLPLYSC